MSSTFRAGAQELADEVARAHDAGPGLPTAAIGARSRRARRRHDAALAVGACAAVAVLALGGAAVLDRGVVVPPAGGPTEPGPTEPGTASPTPTDTSSADPADPAAGLLGPDDVEGMFLDPAAVGDAIAGLGDLRPFEADLEWGLRSDVVVEPSEDCRRAITGVLEPPGHFEARLWTSAEGEVVQEVLLLADAEAAAAEFQALTDVLAACPEYGGSVPGSSGAWYVTEHLDDGAGPLPSVRVAGTENGEGNANSRLAVDVLVGNAIVRTEVFRFDGAEDPPPATPAEAAALDALLQELLGAA